MSMQLHHTLMSQYKHGTASGIGSVSYESAANCVTPEVVIYGKCVQDSYTGKNLFDVNNAKIIQAYLQVEADGAGTLAKSDACVSVYIPCKPNTTYTVSKISSQRFGVCFTSSIPEVGGNFSNGLLYDTATKATRTAPSDAAYIVVWVYNSLIDTDITADKILASLQIEVGETATSYEPYVGGIASPNPLYPQYIVCNNNTYKCHGKNLLPFPYATNVGTYVRNGVTFTINEDGSITIKGTAIAGANLTLLNSADFGATSIDARFTDSATNGEYAVSKYLFYYATSKILTVNIGYGDHVDETIYPQVEKGKIISTYDPYFDGGTVTAPELYAVGDVRDEYYPLTGKIVRRCGKVDVSSLATWWQYPSSSQTELIEKFGFSFCTIVNGSKAGLQTSMCTHFKNIDYAYNEKGKGVYGIYTDYPTNMNHYFRAPNESVTTVAEFKAWLDEQKAAGTPVTLVYVLAEPVIEYVEPVQIYSKRSVNTASSFNPVLKAVGDIKDEYNPLTGEYIRRCQTTEVRAEWQYPPDDSPSLETQGKSFCFSPLGSAMGYNTSICTHFDNVDASWLGDYKDRYGIYTDHPTVIARYFRAPNESVTTVAEFTAWLVEQDKAGTPVLLTYVLAEPISGIVSGDVTIIEEDVNSAVTGTQIDVKYLTHS